MKRIVLGIGLAFVAAHIEGSVNKNDIEKRIKAVETNLTWLLDTENNRCSRGKSTPEAEKKIKEIKADNEALVKFVTFVSEVIRQYSEGEKKLSEASSLYIDLSRKLKGGEQKAADAFLKLGKDLSEQSMIALELGDAVLEDLKLLLLNNTHSENLGKCAGIPSKPTAEATDAMKSLQAAYGKLKPNLLKYAEKATKYLPMVLASANLHDKVLQEHQAAVNKHQITQDKLKQAYGEYIGYFNVFKTQSDKFKS